MKISELPILARIDPKTQKRRAAAKKCCGWEKPAISRRRHCLFVGLPGILDPEPS